MSWLEDKTNEDNWLEGSDSDGVYTDNCYLSEMERGLNLITALISAPEDKFEADLAVEKLKSLIDEDYTEFADKEDLPNETEMFNKIQIAFDQIEEMIKFPELYNKAIVAVGGSFSAGKSQFINSILDTKFLPTDTTPTTSIPTFLVQGRTNRIEAFNTYGKKIRINHEAMEAISHAFANHYNISFSHILKYINACTVDMDYENIAFLDTPGYTKSQSYQHSQYTDKEIAKEQLGLADYVIWIIDSEKGGLPAEDINFIQSLDVKKPILFVVNKADKKTKSDLKKIISKIEEDIEENSLFSAGIIAYSSVLGKEYFEEKLFSYLEEIEGKKIELDLFNGFREAFNVYRDYHQEVVEEERDRLEVLNDIILEIAKYNDDMSDLPNQIIDEIKDNIKFEKDILQELNNLQEKFKSQIETIDIKIQEKQKKVNQRDKIYKLIKENSEVLLTELEKLKKKAINKMKVFQNDYSYIELEGEKTVDKLEYPYHKWWHFFSPAQYEVERNILLLNKEKVVNHFQSFEEEIKDYLLSLKRSLDNLKFEVNQEELAKFSEEEDMKKVNQVVKNIQDALNNCLADYDLDFMNYKEDIVSYFSNSNLKEKAVVEFEVYYAELLTDILNELREVIEDKLNKLENKISSKIIQFSL